MKFYNKYHKNCYEELRTYYPFFYENVYEMQEILKTFGALSDDLEAAIEQTFLNNFILHADSDTLKIWENIFNISYSDNPPTEQRRRVIIGYISGEKHIGEPEIRSLFSTYKSVLQDISLENGIVKIHAVGAVFDEGNFFKTFLKIIPAHLKPDITVQINRIAQNPAKPFGGVFCFTRITPKLINQEENQYV